jgi:phosphoglycerol transferase
MTWLAVLTRIFGLFPGANAGLLAAHLLAAASLLLVCRWLRYDLFFSVAAALLFAFSRFSFVREFSHITVNYYWHVPLGLLVIYWCLQPEPLTAHPRRLWASIGIAVLHGIQSPYYAGLFGQFLLCTSLVLLLGRAGWYRIGRPLLLAAVVVATFVFVNLDTLTFRLQHGANRIAVARSLVEVEMYALKPIELLLPVGHRIPQFASWATNAYFNRAYVQGEIGSPYLGIIGIFALLMLIWSTARALALQQSASVPRHFWGVLWIVAFSVIGGLNSLLGAAGLLLFRSSNRYSIVLLALLLLFFVRQLSAWARRWHLAPKRALAGAIVVVGLLDQMPPQQPPERIAAIRAMIETDMQFTNTLEQQLPAGAMIFELPIMDFPEAGPTGSLVDYEHFRPYFFSRGLRYSYGSNKGRPRERWQREAEQLGVPQFVKLVEQYGFASVLIARKGYADRGAALQQSLAAAGRERVLAASPDLVAIELQPSQRPHLPPEFSPSFHPLEGDATLNRRWSGGNARIVLHNPASEPRMIRVRFSLETNEPRHLQFESAREPLYTARLDPAQPPPEVDLALTLQPGRNELAFKTDVRGKPPLSGSNRRRRAFALVNFQLSE